MKDLIVGLLLGAITSYIWTTLMVNKNIVTPYKKTISDQKQEIYYIKNELLERNNELIRAHKYIIYLEYQYRNTEKFAQQFNK